MQDDDSLLRSFMTIKPAAEKILSDGTDVDGTAKYRRKRTKSLGYLSELSFHHARELVSGSAFSHIKAVIIEYQNRYSVTRKTFFYENNDKIFQTINN
jgi:hypothetical protein